MYASSATGECAQVRNIFGSTPSLALTALSVAATGVLLLDEIALIANATQLLFAEALHPHCGRQAVVNRLFEVIIIQLIRHLMANNAVNIGLLAGLAHAQLQRAIVAMHEAPAEPWTLEQLAERAAMSRSAFANTFRDVVGVTPGDYLTGWRITLAQSMVKQGRSLKHIAAEVGYGSEVALSRAFSARVGMSTRAYKNHGVQAI
jgi:transcriptional regulator GlxA family with amidase domain